MLHSNQHGVLEEDARVAASGGKDKQAFALNSIQSNSILPKLSNVQYEQSILEEDARVAASNGQGKTAGVSASKRPDLVARSYMEAAKLMINTGKVLGHVPGFKCNHR